MLNFNGKTYARNDAEFTGSLFRPGNTCHGFYKQTKGGFRLYDMQKNLRAYIVHNPRQGYFTVSASMTDKGPRLSMAITPACILTAPLCELTFPRGKHET